MTFAEVVRYPAGRPVTVSGMRNTLGTRVVNANTPPGDTPTTTLGVCGGGQPGGLATIEAVTKPRIPDVLAARYASAELVAIWSPEEKVRAERRLWLAVLSAQADLGIPVPDGVIEAYAAVVDEVDL